MTPRHADRLSRRSLFSLLAAAIPAAFAAARLRAQTKIPMTVFKDPSCGCCEKWIAHMSANGFAPAVTNTPDMNPVKTRYHVPAALQSCHTASVAGYVIEGHVPASDVKALLAKKPAGTVGLAIPGMPQSAPGMDGMPFQPYTVLAFDAAGKTTTFAQHQRAS